MNPLVVNAWKRLKTEFTRAQTTISSPIKKMLDSGGETLVSRADLQRQLASKDGEAARDAEAREKLDYELRDAKLKLKIMEDWMKRATDGD